MAITEAIPGSHNELDIRDDYRRIVEGALPDMGYRPEAEGVPALERVQAGIDRIPGLADWLVERADNGAQDTLVISRTVGGEQGIGVARTILALDAWACVDIVDTYIWGAIWGKTLCWNNAYTNKAVAHDNAGSRGLQTKWDTAILLRDPTDPATGKDAYDPGLAYTSQTVAEQREAFAREAAGVQKQRGITIVTATLGAIVTDYAAIRSEGDPKREGVTRFIHYPPQTLGGDQVTYVPSVYHFGRLTFDISSVGSSWSGFGVRRLVRVPTPLDV